MLMLDRGGNKKEDVHYNVYCTARKSYKVVTTHLQLVHTIEQYYSPPASLESSLSPSMCSSESAPTRRQRSKDTCHYSVLILCRMRAKLIYM